MTKKKDLKRIGEFALFVALVILLAIPSAACSKAAPETVEDILSQAADVTLAKYDCIYTWPTRTQISKVCVKNNKMRVEHTSEGQTVQTYLLDMEEGTVYLWNSPENIPRKTSIATGEVADFVSAMGMASAALHYNPRIVSTETIDGKDCFVVEYVSGDLAIRVWIWKRPNFLVRQDITGAEHTTTIEFKNIEFGHIPDSMFELPEVPAPITTISVSNFFIAAFPLYLDYLRRTALAWACPCQKIVNRIL